jgi:hypothetical protein
MFFKLNKEQVALYPLFSCLCPFCREMAEFWIDEQRAKIGAPIGLLNVFPVDSEYLVRCGKCGFNKYLESEEEAQARLVAAFYQQLQDGQLSMPSFLEKVVQLPAPTLHGLIRGAAAWKCGSCGEENPLNFDTCWSCQKPKG